jgi:peptidoglycan/LPS O-acetylase OafA/YrhL
MRIDALPTPGMEHGAAGDARVQDLTDRARIPGLDGIRAVAILVVMLGHYGLGRFVPGGFGVTIFFFVSGFLITTLLLREHERNDTLDLRNFYLRRLLRLTPELAAFVLITGTVAVWQGYTLRPMELAAALFYATNYYHLSQGMCIDACADWHSLWSLAVEEHFYLMFPPLLLALAASGRRLLAVLGAVIVACLLWRFAIVASGRFPADWTYKASDARIDSIAYGCWLAVVFATRPRWLGWAWERGGLVLGAAAALTLLSLAVRDPMFRETLRYSIQGVALALAFVALYASAGGRRIVALLDRTVPRWIGRVSYGAYLWHFVPLALGLHLLGAVRPHDLEPSRILVLCVGCILGTLALAWVSESLVARPVLALRHRFAPRPPVGARGERPSRAAEPRLGEPAEVLGR